MKKILSAILAVAMIASMSAVAFAAQPNLTGVSQVTYYGEYNNPNAPATAEGVPTVKVEDGRAWFPVVGVAGPFGYNNEDKTLYNETKHSANGYAAPIEYGDTAYYALVQWMPEQLKTGTTISKTLEKLDGVEIDVTGTGDDKFDNKLGYYTIVTESETVSSLKIKQEWEEGDDLVKSVSIVKKKIVNADTTTAGDGCDWNEYSGDDSDEDEMYYPGADSLGLDDLGYKKGTSATDGMYLYFLAIKYKDSTSVNESDVIGTVTLSKSKDPSVDKLEINIANTIDWENSYRNDINGDDFVVDGDQADLEAGKNYALKFTADDEVELVFDDDSYFEVDVSGQSKMFFSYNTDYISKVAARYPYAELNFWNGNGAKFNRVGQMFLSCEDLVGTQFLYQVSPSGLLTEVPGAEWDDSDEGFYFNTRVLGSYVISDMELDVVDTTKAPTNNDTVVAPAPVITNPSTGAAA